MLQRTMQIERLESRATPAVLLADSFASLAFNPVFWDTATLATIAPAASAASAPLAARFNGNAAGGDELRSVEFPVAGATSATLSYSFARTGAGSRPQSAEDLVVELRTNGGAWTEVARHLATEPDMAAMARRSITVALPPDATTFQLRVRHLGVRPQLGDYWLDDVSLVTGNAQVSGRLWFDRDENALADAEDIPLSGWAVFADVNRNGTLDAGEPRTITDADGNYTLAELPPGGYAIRPDVPIGWYATGPRHDHLVHRDDIRTSDAAELAGARAVVASGDGRFLYVAASQTGAIAVIERSADGDLNVLQIVTGDAIGGQTLADVAALALSGDGRSLYAALGESDALVVLDRDDATGLLAWRETLPAADVAAPFDFPAALLVSPDGRQLYVAASNSATLLTFARDDVTGELALADSLALGGAGLAGASAIAISPDGRSLYVAASGDKALVTLARNVSTGQLSHIETLLDDTSRAGGLDGASAVAVSPDGRHVVVAGGFDDALAVFARNATTGRLEFRDLVANGAAGTPSLDGPQSLAFTPDGQSLFVAAINSDAITAFHRDAASGQLTPVLVLDGGIGPSPGLDGVRSLAILPDGGVVAAAFHNPSVVSFVADAAQANLSLANGQKIASIDFGLSRDSAQWKGAGNDTLWSTPTNWHGNVPPLDGEAITIAAAEGTLVESVNDLGEDFSIARLTLHGGGGDLSGDPLTFLDNAATGAPTIVATQGPHRIAADVRFGGPATIALGDSTAAEEGAPLVGDLLIAGDMQGNAVTLVGSGRANLTGDVELGGRLTVAGGTLQIDGTFAATDVVVNALATLAGKGLVASTVAVESDAQLSPGGMVIAASTPAAGAAATSSSNSVDSASVVGTISSGDLTLSSGATLMIDILADEVSAIHDAVAVAGGVTIDGAILAFVLAGRLPIDVEYVIVDNDGTDPIVGQFTGVSENAYFEIDGQRFRLSYVGGDGNDISIYAPPTGEVFGRAWRDDNANRTIDSGEPPLAAWTVFADVNGNGNLDPGEPTAATDANGEYHLLRVPVGRTRILPLLVDGWQATTPAPLVDFINHVETTSIPTGSTSPRLDGVRGVTISGDGRHAYTVANNDDALVTFRRDTFSGRLSFVGEARDGIDGVNGLNGARGVAISGDGRHVYVAGYFDDAVATFARNAITGELTLVEALLDNTSGVDGLDGATAVIVSPDDRHVYVAGYLDDAVAVFSRDALSGRLAYVGRMRDGVGGINGLDGAHGLAISPDGKHLYVAGATDNALAVFRRDSASGNLTFAAVLVDGQGGVTTLGVARSVAVSPDGRFVFAEAELDNAVTTFRRDAATGLLTVASIARSGTAGIGGMNGPTAVVVSPDGQRLYVASSGDDALVAFDVDRISGVLVYREHLSYPTTSGLDGAAAVALSPDGDHIYVAGQNSDAVVFAARTLPSDVVVLSPGEIVVGIDHGAINPPPRVVAIAARSSGWSTSFTASLNPNPTGIAGLPLAESVVNLSPYPGIDEFVVRFNENVAPRSVDFDVFGVAQPAYRPALVSYDAATFTAVWRVFAPIDADKLLVQVSANLMDTGGAMLGSDVVRRLDVLGGSTAGGNVQPADLTRVLVGLFARIGLPGYDATADINGDGRVNYVDAILARNLVGNELPTGEPTAAQLPPAVAAAYLDGAAWSGEFRQSLADATLGDAAWGWSIAAGLGQSAGAPWTNVDQIRVRFTDDVVIGATDLNVAGNAAIVAVSGFSYDAATHTATWTLTAPLSAGEWMIAIVDGVASPSGVRLDGETSALSPRWPSGDGIPGGSFAASVQIAPGDADGDGSTDSVDAAVVRAALFSFAGSQRYDPLADIDANGRVNYVDFILARNALGSPPIDSSHAAPPALVVSVTLRAASAQALVVAAPQRRDVSAAPSLTALAAGRRSRIPANDRAEDELFARSDEMAAAVERPRATRRDTLLRRAA
ncbi:MAG: beta-propeller fold lactonase family protein [Pirellulales bacterium]